MTTKRNWQHKTPIRDPHPIRSLWDKRYICAECRRPIVAVDENEGPESLKALLQVEKETK